MSEIMLSKGMKRKKRQKRELLQRMLSFLIFLRKHIGKKATSELRDLTQLLECNYTDQKNRRIKKKTFL